MGSKNKMVLRYPRTYARAKFKFCGQSEGMRNKCRSPPTHLLNLSRKLLPISQPHSDSICCPRLADWLAPSRFVHFSYLPVTGLKIRRKRREEEKGFSCSSRPTIPRECRTSPHPALRRRTRRHTSGCPQLPLDSSRFPILGSGGPRSSSNKSEKHARRPYQRQTARPPIALGRPHPSTAAAMVVRPSGALPRKRSEGSHWCLSTRTKATKTA